MSDFSDSGPGLFDSTGFPSYDGNLLREENLRRLRQFLKENDSSLYEKLMEEEGDATTTTDAEQIFEKYRQRYTYIEGSLSGVYEINKLVTLDELNKNLEERNQLLEKQHETDQLLIEIFTSKDVDQSRVEVVNLMKSLKEKEDEIVFLEKEKEKLVEEQRTLVGNNEVLQRDMEYLYDRIKSMELELGGGGGGFGVRDDDIDTNTLELEILALQNENEKQKRLITFQEKKIMVLNQKLENSDHSLSLTRERLRMSEQRVLDKEIELREKDRIISELDPQKVIDLQEFARELFGEREGYEEETISFLKEENNRLHDRIKVLESGGGGGRKSPMKGKSGVKIGTSQPLQLGDTHNLNMYKRFAVPSIGTNRVELQFSTNVGRQLEMRVDNLQYNVVNDSGDRKMIVGLCVDGGSGTTTTKYITYTYNNGLPRDYIHRKGSMGMTLHNKDLVMKREVYEYEFDPVTTAVVGTEMVIHFMGGVTLYAFSITPSLCKLRMLVLSA
jgi:hypothetical protein